MRLDLAHIHRQEPHARRANHGRDFDVLMMLYIGWHLGSPSQGNHQTPRETYCGSRKQGHQLFRTEEERTAICRLL
jgi:hypothetical protein